MKVGFQIGVGGTLTIILTLAKLFGLFPFSWWIVAAPVLIGYAVTFLLILTAAVALSAYDDDE